MYTFLFYQTKMRHFKSCLNIVGITPKISNEVGLNCELTFKDGLELNPKGSLAAAQKRKLMPGIFFIQKTSLYFLSYTLL